MSIVSLDYIIQRTLPLIFTDDMTLVEMMAAVVAKVKEVIAATNAYTSTDISTVVEARLTAWAGDGTLEAIIGSAMDADIQALEEALAAAILDLGGTGRTTESIKTNADAITVIKGAGWTNQTIKGNSTALALHEALNLADNPHGLETMFGKYWVFGSDFGIVADGITNDAVALQAAIDYAVANDRNLLLPNGTIKITAKITIAGFGLVKVSGSGKTKISVAYNGMGIEDNTTWGVSWDNISLDHAGSTGSVLVAHGPVSLTGVGASTVEGNASDAVILYGAMSNVDGCGFMAGGSGFGLVISVETDHININSRVRHNQFAGINGLKVTSASVNSRPEGLDISGNKFVCTGTYSIKICAGYQISISNNIIDMIAYYAISFNDLVDDVACIQIENNYISTATGPNEGSAIRAIDTVKQLTNLIIKGNHICYTGYGVYMTAKVSKRIIADNTFDVINHTAITIAGGGDSITSGNMCNDVDYSLVLADGADAGLHILNGNVFNAAFIITPTVAANIINEHNFYGTPA